VKIRASAGHGGWGPLARPGRIGATVRAGDSGCGLSVTLAHFWNANP
jgi:hypothetical protein